ncbi:hypothetical protein QQM79_17710 [Marinobacteraceae bacterium S3BR75-40.1]
MKKTLIASAVAAATFAAPVMAQMGNEKTADLAERLDAMPKI